MIRPERGARRSFFVGSTVKKKLSDITNILPQPKSAMDMRKDDSLEDYVDHLVKENMALVKLFQDKNKIIELSGTEIQKLRVNLQKMQLQNRSLAQSNSQMTAELAFNKEKLMSLQHEIACKEALRKAKLLEAKEPENTNGEKHENQDGEAATVNALSAGNIENSKPSIGRPLRPTRSRSMSHSTASQQVGKEEAAGKRRRLRRQSTSCTTKKQQEEEPVEDLFELEENIQAQFLHDKHPASQQPNRTSIGRPLRKAAEKVQSYKETPINVKMRRSD
ncbi:hypothetical protein DM860_006209 [Cuscuta australis]|uniref:Shugoshin C-terminal domain-containing protein n=1 Tax=Cuscuta australis TaxID=267555 RepID=A0A328DJX8_9ASTE|nr:hypothetical protein DM860_006209 [Cuscuta australis]